MKRAAVEQRPARRAPRFVSSSTSILPSLLSHPHFCVVSTHRFHGDACKAGILASSDPIIPAAITGGGLPSLVMWMTFSESLSLLVRIAFCFATCLVREEQGVTERVQVWQPAEEQPDSCDDGGPATQHQATRQEPRSPRHAPWACERWAGLQLPPDAAPRQACCTSSRRCADEGRKNGGGKRVAEQSVSMCLY